MSTKKLVFGVVLPLLLSISGVSLVVFLQVPEPQKSRLANPNNEGELLQYLTAAEVAQVKLLNEPLEIDASGTVVPFREIELAAQVVGQIVEKDPIVRSGNYVEQGAVLYRIDPKDYELEIERLTRRREQELATIEELDLEIDNANKLLEVAEEQQKLAEADVKRFETMSSGFSSAAELDTARRSLLTARNQKLTLQNQRDSSEKRRSRLELAVRLVETELQQARLNLERTEIRSPVSGRVVNELVEADSYVQRGTPLVVIEDTEKVEVACNIRMDQLSWILEQPNASRDSLLNAAQAARLRLPKTPVEVSFHVAGRESTSYVWQGRLDRIEGAGLDPQSRTVPIRILIENPNDFDTEDVQNDDPLGAPLLVRGMFVDVAIQATPTTQLMLVPKLAIKPTSNTNVIWKFEKNREVIRTSPKAVEAIQAYEEAVAAGTVDEIYNTVSNSESGKPASTVESVPAPEDWDAGNLKIVNDVRMVTSYWDDSDIEYWVCEVRSTALAPGDKVVISPLPGIKADGTDAIRVKKPQEAQPSDELASENPSSRQS